MYTVVKQKVNSSELRNRLNFEPDLIQARIMKGETLVWVGECWINQKRQLNRIVKEELAKLSVSGDV
jgi:hypothetical protein